MSLAACAHTHPIYTIKFFHQATQHIQNVKAKAEYVIRNVIVIENSGDAR